jgi:hypothetical protein
VLPLNVHRFRGGLVASQNPDLAFSTFSLPPAEG